MRTPAIFKPLLLLVTLVVGACSSSTAPPRGASPVTLVIVAGDAQVANPGAMLPQPVVARVLDESGQAVSGATVRFYVTAGEGTAAPATATSDAGGRAQTRWTLGSSGSQRLEALVDRGRLSPLTAQASATLGI